MNNLDHQSELKMGPQMIFTFSFFQFCMYALHIISYLCLLFDFKILSFNVEVINQDQIKWKHNKN